MVVSCGVLRIIKAKLGNQRAQWVYSLVGSFIYLFIFFPWVSKILWPKCVSVLLSGLIIGPRNRQTHTDAAFKWAGKKKKLGGLLQTSGWCPQFPCSYWVSAVCNQELSHKMACIVLLFQFDRLSFSMEISNNAPGFKISIREKKTHTFKCS